MIKDYCLYRETALALKQSLNSVEEFEINDIDLEELRAFVRLFDFCNEFVRNKDVEQNYKKAVSKLLSRLPGYVNLASKGK